MKNGFTVLLFCTSIAATGCQQSPSNAPGLRDNLVPVGTAGETATPSTGSQLVTPSAPTTVNCGVNRQAVVRHAQIDGRTVEQVDCIAPAAASYTPAGTRVVSSQRVVRSEVRRRKGRSWQKSALVIGGSSAAGAGIGALIGGKKGALIGAAAGGGAGTVYEVQKRKHR